MHLTIEKIDASLDEMAERGRVVPELDQPTVRERVVGSYRLIYEIDKENVYVLVSSTGPVISGPCGTRRAGPVRATAEPCISDSPLARAMSGRGSTSVPAPRPHGKQDFEIVGADEDGAAQGTAVAGFLLHA